MQKSFPVGCPAEYDAVPRLFLGGPLFLGVFRGRDKPGSAAEWEQGGGGG